MRSPRPYYQDDLVTLYHGDSTRLLRRLGIKADCVVTDPPFEETALKWDRWPSGWPSIVATHAAAANASLWCFGSTRLFLEKRDEIQTSWRYIQDLVWEKQNGTSLLNDRFRRVHEMALQFTLRGAKWGEVFKAPQYTHDGTARRIIRQNKPAHFGQIAPGKYESVTGGQRLERSVIYAKNCHHAADHPTQKPEGLLRTLIAYSCPPGGLVLDCFAGSGSTLRAAKQLGRRAVGIEADKTYCESAARLLRQDVFNFEEASR